MLDEGSKKYYFYNADTGESDWAQPTSGTIVDELPRPVPRRRTAMDTVKNAVFNIVTLPFLLTICVPALAAIFIFSEMHVFGNQIGRGGTVARFLRQHHALSSVLLASSAALTLVLYLLDASYWPSSCRLRKWALLSVTGLGFLAGTCLSAKDTPAAPFALYLLVYPAWASFMKATLYRKMYIPNFLSAVAAVLGTVGVLMCSLFAHWVFAGNWWGPGLKEVY